MIIKRKRKHSIFNDTISATFSIPRPIWGREEAQSFFNILEKYGKYFYPNMYAHWLSTWGNYKRINIDKECLLKLWEPYWRKYEGPNNEIIESVWVESVSLKKSRSPHIEYIIEPHWNYNRDPIHCSLKVDCDPAEYHLKNPENEKKLWNLLRDFAEYAKCDFGSIHFATAKMHKDAAYGKGNINLIERGSHWTTHLPIFIPDIYLVTIFGQPYIELFGRQQILSAPCHVVEELSCGSIWLQLLPGLPQKGYDFKILKEKKQKVKEHLNNNAFFDFSHSKSSGYKTPKFDLTELTKPIDLPKPEKVPWR